MEFDSVNTYFSCCDDSELLKKLSDNASFFGNHLILEQMQHKSDVLPLELLLTQAINSGYCQ